MPSNRLELILKRLQEAHRPALIAYLTAGDPDLETSFMLARAVAEAGADVLELGLPFSDPLADGPVLQAASQRALDAGTTTKAVLDLARRLRKALPARSGLGVPLVLLTYYNPVLQQGLDGFCQKARESGIDALVVPDLAYEESGPLRAACQAEDLVLVDFIAPTTPPSRQQIIAAGARGFIYCVAVTGVTGARAELWPGLEEFIRGIRQYTGVPLAVGFGINGPEQARAVARFADAVIVGSALVQRAHEAGSRAVEAVSEFTASIRQALDG